MDRQLLQFTAFFAAMAQHFGTELLKTQEKLIETQVKLIDANDKLFDRALQERKAREAE